MQSYIEFESDICFLIDQCTDNDVDFQLSQYIASRQDIVTFKNLLSNVQVFKPRFVHEIKDPYIDKVQEKSRLVR